MPLTIETERAGQLAEELARRTGRTTAQVIEQALEREAEALERRETTEEFVARVRAFTAKARRDTNFDTRPFTQEEADWASGERDEHPFRR